LGLLDEARRNGAVLGYNYPGDPWYGDAYKLLTSKGLRPAVEPKSGGGLIKIPFRKNKNQTVPPPNSGTATAVREEPSTGDAGAEDLVLRRSLAADGRSRAFVNDQSTGVGVLKELGEALLEVHGQHETVGLLDAKTHRPMLDAYGDLDTVAVAEAWRGWRAAR